MRLDLHTHYFETTNFACPHAKIVKRIVTRAKEKNLDGIAITAHSDKDYAYLYLSCP